MTLEEALKEYKKPAKNKVPEWRKVIVEKTYRLFGLIRQQHDKPIFKDKFIPLSSAFGYFSDDLSTACKLDAKSFTIEEDVITFEAEEYWAYGGYAEGIVKIPVKNLDLTEEQIYHKCLDYAIEYRKEKINDAKEWIRIKEEEIQKEEQEIAILREECNNFQLNSDEVDKNETR